MLEHQKMVLKGVFDNKYLFKKELIKSMSWLNKNDQILLKMWIYKNFRDQHPDIINDVLFSENPGFSSEEIIDSFIGS